jgi:hypothetical protein
VTEPQGPREKLFTAGWAVVHEYEEHDGVSGDAIRALAEALERMNAVELGLGNDD